MGIERLAVGEAIEALDAYGKWRPGVARSDVEGSYIAGKKVHDFPVIWVALAGSRDVVPWPAKDVRTSRSESYEES